MGRSLDARGRPVALAPERHRLQLMGDLRPHSVLTADQLNTALAGRYAIERRGGERAMATVYLARDLRHNGKVASKVLKPDYFAIHQ